MYASIRHSSPGIAKNTSRSPSKSGRCFLRWGRGVDDPANELARSDKWFKWGKEFIKPFGRIAISKHSQRLADLPVPGEQLVELADRAFRNPAQHIGEPRLRIDVVESAGLDSENTYPSIFVNRLI